MYLKVLLFLIATLLLYPLPDEAQKVKLVNSTEQRWSGGIAGRSGENYNFIIEFSGYSKEPVPQTLWLGKEQFPLITDNATQQGNITVKRLNAGKTLRIEIHARTYHDEYAERQNALTGGGIKKDKISPPKIYKGKALLVYNYIGKEQYFEINKIKQMLPPIDYP